MTPITIPAEVVNGHLRHDADLAAMEGQRVWATLTVAPPKDATGNGATTSKPLVGSDELDPEPPPWLEVENDLFFPMMVPEILLERKPLIVERGTPSIILPEELPDE